VVAEAIWDGQKMSYPPATMVLGLTALLLFSGARAAERQYQLHFLGVSCFIGPCPGWQATDTETGEKFVAVVDFTGIAKPPSNSNDLVASASRARLERPNGGGSYETLTVTAIIKATPSVPGYQP
jgi:hypothetical protein